MSVRTVSREAPFVSAPLVQDPAEIHAYRRAVTMAGIGCYGHMEVEEPHVHMPEDYDGPMFLSPHEPPKPKPVDMRVVKGGCGSNRKRFEDRRRREAHGMQHHMGWMPPKSNNKFEQSEAVEFVGLLNMANKSPNSVKGAMFDHVVMWLSGHASKDHMHARAVDTFVRWVRDTNQWIPSSVKDPADAHGVISDEMYLVLYGLFSTLRK